MSTHHLPYSENGISAVSNAKLWNNNVKRKYLNGKINYIKSSSDKNILQMNQTPITIWLTTSIPDSFSWFYCSWKSAKCVRVKREIRLDELLFLSRRILKTPWGFSLNVLRFFADFFSSEKISWKNQESILRINELHYSDSFESIICIFDWFCVNLGITLPGFCIKYSFLVIQRNIVTKNLNTKIMFTDSSLALRMTIYYYDFLPPKLTQNPFKFYRLSMTML